MLRVLGAALVFAGGFFDPFAAAQAEGPRFEVVAIKLLPRPTPGDGSPFGLSVSGARVQMTYRLIDLLTKAWRVELAQVEGPDFTRDEFFDVQATIPAGATREQVPEMLQAMLAERFKLVYHRETREYKLNVLTVGKSGMRLARLPEGTPTSYRQTWLADGATRITQIGKVASIMNAFGGLQMVNETGLDGIYTWVRDEAAATAGLSYQDAVQESFTAMIEAAGLKLETRKVPKETIIVDHLEKIPTEN